MHDIINKQNIILFICHESSRTGAPISLLTLMEWLIRKKNVPCRVIINKGGALTGSFARLAPTLVLHPDTPRFFLTRFLLRFKRRTFLKSKIRKFIDSVPGLIYSNTSANGILSELLKKMYPVPVITNVRELKSIISSLGKDNLRSVLKITNRYIAVSQAARKNLILNLNVSPDKITVIHGAIKMPDGILPSREMVLEKFKLPKNKMIVGAAGMVDLIKGYDLFIDTAEYVVKSRKADNIIFIWVGRFGRGLDRAVGERIGRIGLENSVFFLGESDKPYDIFNVFDIFYLSSREDTFPRVMLECAYLGKPTICFEDSGGCIEFVNDDTGIKIKGFNARAAGDKIIELVSDRAKLKILGANAKRIAESNYTIDQQGESYYRVINEVMNRSDHHQPGQINL